MKKTVIACALTALITGAIPASAFLDRMNWDTVESVHYFVQASGKDTRVYEWESQMVEGKTCVAMFSEAGGPVGMDCHVE